jgi:hypothetical protein
MDVISILESKKGKNFQISFLAKTQDEIDANEFKSFLIKNHKYSITIEQRKPEGFFIKGQSQSYDMQTMSKEFFFQQVGILYYYSLEYFCELRSVGI